MGPSVRELVRRIEDGERMKPADVRAVVLVLAEAYETVRSATVDGIVRRLHPEEARLYIAEALDAAEDMLTEDLHHARVAIGCAEFLCRPGVLREG